MSLQAHLFAARSNAAASALTSHRFWRLPRTMIETIKLWQRRSRDRAALRRYVQCELRDGTDGLSNAARIECAKPFWEA